MSEILKGNAIMLFFKENNDYIAIAYGRNHELSLEYDTQKVHTRQDNEWMRVRATKSSWSINCEHIYSEDIDKLTSIFTNKQKVTVMFGQASNYTPEGIVGTSTEWEITTGYRGRAIIESLVITAQTNELASCQISLKGVSGLKKVNASDPEDSNSHSTTDKIVPTLEFTTTTNTSSFNNSNEYTLSDFTTLNNPSDLPVRYIVTPFNARLIID